MRLAERFPFFIDEAATRAEPCVISGDAPGLHEALLRQE